MKKLISIIQEKAAGRTVMFLFILTMASYFYMLMFTIPMLEKYAPGIDLFDLSPSGYSYDHAIMLLDNLGESGRSVYLTQQLPADFIYPGLFAISYSLLLTWLFLKSFDPKSWVYYMVFFPILAGLFDYLENIGIILMIHAYPDLTPGLVRLASTFTVLKSSFTTLFFLGLFFGFAAWVVSLIRSRKEAYSSL
jgi:hypothetical protein